MEFLKRVQPPVFPVRELKVPEATYGNLDNGIPLFLIEAGTEDILRIEFTFPAGLAHEYLPLLASTTNMMLSEGSENYTSSELHSTLEFYGAFLHLNIEKDRAGIVVFCLSRHVEKILELCAEILFRPVFPEAELNALMKKRVQWFLINREKVQNVANDKFFESVFGRKHPYGYQLSKEDFGKMSPSLLTAFHRKYYTSEKMAIVISGKIPASVKSLINSFFGGMKHEKLSEEVNSPILKGAGRKRFHIEKPGAVQTAIKIGSATINKRHPDYPGLKVLDTLLGGYFGSRLMRNIREDKGYTYGIRSNVSSLELSGYKMISSEVGSKHRKKALEEIHREIRILHEQLVPPGELQVVRNYMSGELLRMFDGPFALAESFLSAWEFGLDNSYYYRFADKIKTIEPDEIKHLASTYYNPDDLYEITVGTK